jgi:hypothetical protein
MLIAGRDAILWLTHPYVSVVGMMPSYGKT